MRNFLNKRFVSGILAVVLILLVISLSGCFGGIVGSGPITTRDFDISDFNAVEAGGAFKVQITRVETYKVSITTYENLFDYLNVTKEGSTLKVGFKPGSFSYSSSPEAVITIPDLRGISLSGATKGTATNFISSNPLSANVSGASELEMINCEAGDSQFDISGASKLSGQLKAAAADFAVSGGCQVELSGSATDCTINVNGGSQMMMPDFAITGANVTVTGGSRATINVSGNMDVELSGGSTLDYYGNPVLGEVNVSGVSSFNHK